MKVKSLCAWAIVAIIAFSSCDQIKTDDFNRVVGTLYQQEMDGYEFFIKIDNGPTLVSDDYEFLPSSFKDTARIVFYYSEVGEKENNSETQILSKIRDVQKVITLPVYFFDDETDEIERDSIGTAPVDILGAWITDDYLNIEFLYWGSGIQHRFYLVFDEVNPTSTLDELYVGLLHQDYGDPLLYEFWDVISYDISSLQVYQQDSFAIRLEAPGYNDYFYTNRFIYNFSD